MRFRRNLRLIAFLTLSSVACVTNEPVIPERGRERCSHCSMAIVDMKFHAQLVTEKGRRYYFDSIECLHSFEKTGDQKVKFAWVADFENADRMISKENAVIVKSLDIRSPMGGGLAAFSSLEKANEFLKKHKGSLVQDEAKVR